MHFFLLLDKEEYPWPSANRRRDLGGGGSKNKAQVIIPVLCFITVCGVNLSFRNRCFCNRSYGNRSLLNLVHSLFKQNRMVECSIGAPDPHR